MKNTIGWSAKICFELLILAPHTALRSRLLTYLTEGNQMIITYKINGYILSCTLPQQLFQIFILLMSYLVLKLSLPGNMTLY